MIHKFIWFVNHTNDGFSPVCNSKISNATTHLLRDNEPLRFPADGTDTPVARRLQPGIEI